MTKIAGIFLCAFALLTAAQQESGRFIPQKDSSYIDAHGTAHVTRLVPVPNTVSPQAQKFLARPIPDVRRHETIAQRRANTDRWQNAAGAAYRKAYPVNIREGRIAGVPVRIVTPLSVPANRRDRVLINVHGGGFVVDSGSLTETIPIANLTKTEVVAVLYRLAPEHPFPAAVDDAVAVYRALLKTHRPEDMAIYGTSAGAILTGEIAVKLRQLRLPLPAALGIFSGFGDFSKEGDSRAIFGLDGLSGPLSPPSAMVPENTYVRSTNLEDPVLSPIYADLRGFPPTLFVTSERDMLLSGTANLHRAFLRAGVDAHLVVFDGLPHAFWNDVYLPESKEADGIMAKFFDKYVGRKGL